MGYYINSPGGKEAWLRANGRLASPDQPLPKGEHFVCLVDNGWMTAAGIAFNEDELQYMIKPDGRPKTWYAVKDELIVQMCPEVYRDLGGLDR